MMDNKQKPHERIRAAAGERIRAAASGSSPHKGVDYAVPVGTEVRATADGIVSKAYFSRTYGKLLLLIMDYHLMEEVMFTPYMLMVIN
ncbi:M23 family metallopeptidase [Polaribacter sp. HL-MS24]|nr:M23 family metallopeptidase [Polaribacter sp. HL-MS24]WOC39729.1 M23 family metallopeptidase [Polaribacter sp. HL-MS24]